MKRIAASTHEPRAWASDQVCVRIVDQASLTRKKITVIYLDKLHFHTTHNLRKGLAEQGFPDVRGFQIDPESEYRDALEGATAA